MLVHRVLTHHNPSEPLLQKTEQWEVTGGDALMFVIQEITNIGDGPRGELSRVNINIHEDKVFWAEEVKWNRVLIPPKNNFTKGQFKYFFALILDSIF